MTATQDILNKLGEGGYRLTSSRRRLLDTLLARNVGFTAEELVAEAKGVGRATVYRTIRLLLDEGVLCKLALEDGAPKYALSLVGHHHHVVCVRCGSIREFRESVLERVLGDLNDDDMGTVVGHRIEVYVVCPTCRVAGGAQPLSGTATERKHSH